VIAACRVIVALLLTAGALSATPAVAGQLGDEGPDRLLIADPSPALRAYLVDRGFVVESLERLEALDFSLMTAAPPPRMRPAAALDDLRAAFPNAIMALDDTFRLAHDTRLRSSRIVQPRQVLAAIGWQAEDGVDPGAGMRIGMIDSSLDPAHPALAHAALVERVFISGKAPAVETAHGTAIAAMLVGDSAGQSVSGLLRGATLYHAGIFQDSRQGPMASSSDFLRAVDWMLKSGIKIINASITSASKNAVVLYAMTMLSHKKAIIIAAAGNGGPSGPPAYPAAFDSAVAVTAVSVAGDAYPYANTGDYIDIAAPGANLPTVSRGVTSGTSLAVPFVTAAIARMVQACDVSTERARLSLQAHARDLGPRGWDARFGWGLLQVPQCGPATTQLSAKVASRARFDD
jgi:subtilase family protein